MRSWLLERYRSCMPSLRHDGLVELVRQHPPLAVDLVRLANAYPLPADVVAVLGSEDMTDVAPGQQRPRAETAPTVASRRQLEEKMKSFTDRDEADSMTAYRAGRGQGQGQGHP